MQNVDYGDCVNTRLRLGGYEIKVIIDEARASAITNYIRGIRLPLYLDSSIS